MAMPDTIEVPVKVYQTSDKLMVAAPMPGLGPEDIAVEVTGTGHLLIQGILCGDEACGALKGGKDVVAEEWTVGPYRRDIALPAAVDGQGATGPYGNGVLVVAMPIAPSTRPAQLRLDRLAPDRGVRVGAGAHASEKR
jgi:HSP20 family protein